MQQRDPQQGYRFPGNPPTQYRFPQNQQKMQGYEQQPPMRQQPWLHDNGLCADCPYRQNQRKHRHRRKFSILRTAFMLIGVGTVFVLAAKYVVIPLLVYLNVLAGGTL